MDNGITHLYTEATVAVIIEDVNDNSPTFSNTVYDVVISEDVQPGYMVSSHL